MNAFVVVIYGILIAAGGVIGYVKANSVVSVIAGGISGIALVGAGVAMMKGHYNLGWWMSLVFTLLLLARFVISSVDKGKVSMMPAGIVIILSLIVIAALFANRSPIVK